MKTILLLLCSGLLALTGCSHQYVMKLNNGTRIVTDRKPTLEKGSYVYKDAKGVKHFVSQGRVVEIAPASMASEDTSKFKAQKSK
jgi:hypothetical protein